MAWKTPWTLLKRTFNEWSEDNVSRMSGALAYYTIFALAPTLIISIAIVGFIFGKEAAEGEVYRQLSNTVGENAAVLVERMIQNAAERGSGITATLISVVILIVAATGVFAEMQNALDTIWEVQSTRQGWLQIIRTRLLSFAMVLVIAFVFLASLVISAALSAMSNQLTTGVIGQIVNQVISLIVFTVLFAAIFKILPDVEIRWRQVWIGAGATAVLFTIGKYLIGLYLARGTVTSVFGAAGSLVALLVWVYYSAQILYLGAEFTQVYARWSGHRIQPAENAERVTEISRSQQGMSAGKQRKPEPKEQEPAAPLAVPLRPEVAIAPNYLPTARRGLPMLLGLGAGALLMRLRGRRRRVSLKHAFQPGWSSR